MTAALEPDEEIGVCIYIYICTLFLAVGMRTGMHF